MKKTMICRVVSSLLLMVIAVVSSVILLGCPGVTPPNIKSSDKSMQGLAGGLDCEDDKLKGKQSPYIVNSGDDVRADLEVAMDDGVVIVRYGCDAIEIIDDCRLEGGSYGYSRITKKTKTLEMKDAASAQANLGGNIGGEIQSEFEMGRSLYLQYAWIGKRKTTVRTIKRSELVGSECGKATHYVRGADVGAFVMQMASSADIDASGSLFSDSASLKTSSSNSSRISDGDHTLCDEGGNSPQQGCSAIIRLSLKPLTAEGDAKVVSTGVEAEVGCRDGFVINSDGICVRKAEAKVFMCEEGNFKQCDEQCTKGSIQSCGSLARLVMSTVEDESKLQEFFGGDESKFEAFLVKNVDAFKKSCDAGEANACTMAGFGLIMPIIASGEPTPESMKEPLALLKSGCGGGEPFSCSLLEQVLVQGSEEVRKKMGVTGGPLAYFSILRRSCNSGNGEACLTLSEEHVRGEYFKTNGVKAGEYSARACYGGVAYSCIMSAALQLGEAQCNSSMKYMAEELGTSETLRKKQVRERICAAAGPLDLDTEDEAAMKPLLLKALAFIKRACDLGMDMACEEYKSGQEMLKSMP